MPCMDGGPSREEQQRQNDDFNTITRLACARCKDLENRNQPIPKFAQDWWLRHKEADRIRAKRDRERRELEEKKQNALKKLSNEDKKVLGL